MFEFLFYYTPAQQSCKGGGESILESDCPSICLVCRHNLVCTFLNPLSDLLQTESSSRRVALAEEAKLSDLLKLVTDMLSLISRYPVFVKLYKLIQIFAYSVWNVEDKQ